MLSGERKKSFILILPLLQRSPPLGGSGGTIRSLLVLEVPTGF